MSLAALTRQVIEFHEAALEDAALEVRIDGDAAVAVEEPLVKRALSNLIGNATRYAKPGTPLAVRIVQAAPGGPVRLEVENTGPAIAPEALPRIFDRFFRVDTVRCTAEATKDWRLRMAALGLAAVDGVGREARRPRGRLATTTAVAALKPEAPWRERGNRRMGWGQTMAQNYGSK